MGKIQKLGATMINALTRDKVLELISVYTEEEIAKLYNLNVSEVSRLLTEKLKGKYKRKPLSELTPQRDMCFYKSPFSEDEEDYGNNQHIKKQIITKEGLLVFSGNSKIYRNKSLLPKVTENYVNVMLENNQPLKFVKQ